MGYLPEGYDGWSNNAAMGYAIMAAKQMSMKEEDIRLLISCMRDRFDFKTLEEAAKEYCESPY